MTMNARDRMRLKNLCAIFKLPLHTTERAPELCQHVLAGLYLVPTIETRAKRHKAVTDLWAPLGAVFEPLDPFVTMSWIIAHDVQEQPGWFPDLKAPTQALVEQHVYLSWVRWGLETAGVGTTFLGAGGAAFAEYVKTRSLREAAIKGGRRAVGQGPALEELSKRGIPGYGAARLTALGLGLAVAGTAVYLSAGERMREIEAILTDRHMSGDVTPDQFARVFGGRIDPLLVKRYWEM